MTRMSLCLTLLGSAQVALGVKPCPSTDAHPWCDPSIPLHNRVDSLMDALHDDELPSLLSNDLFGGTSGIERLGLPKYSWINEADHGVLKYNGKPPATSFPQVGLLAATFNRSLFHAVGVATGREAFNYYAEGQSDGLLLHNNINIFRDPRWGRGQETPGEDPFLVATYSREWTNGIQQLYNGKMLAAAACKHFVAYSLEGTVPHSRHSFNAEVTAQDLADTYIPAFEACVTAGAKGMMCSYNAVNGTPVCANEDLLTDLVRNSWKFDGVIVTDCDAVADLAPGAPYDDHGFAKSKDEASYVAMKAGVDVDCGSTYKNNASLLSGAMLRTAARRVFRLRFELGEFDPVHEDDRINVSWAAHKALAHDSVTQGAVMLKNYMNTLPLKRNLRLAVLGHFANASNALLGDYSSNNVDIDRVLHGLKEFSKNVTFTPGTADVCSDNMDSITRPDADAVIVFVGLKGDDQSNPNPDTRGNLTHCVNSCLEAEGCDRRRLDLPQGQVQLVRHAASWGLPLVLVIVSGGPVELEEFALDPRINSMLWVGYPGQQAGTGIASLIFGLGSPSGRLPITYYRGNYVSAVPMESMAMRPSAGSGYPGRTYRFVDDSFILFPFGFGLSYDSWSLDWVNRKQTVIASSCDLDLEASLPHTVSRPSGAGLVVLLFLRPPVSAHPSAPRKELRGFERILLLPGQRKARVHFKLELHDFELVNTEGQRHLMPGRWTAEIDSPVRLRRTLDVSAKGCFSNAHTIEEIVM